MMAMHDMKIGMYSFHCRDAASLARFWSGVLMRPVDVAATTAFATIGLDDPGPTWMFHQADGDPASGDNRLILDFDGGADWTGQADRVEALGGERVSDNDQTASSGWCSTTLKAIPSGSSPHDRNNVLRVVIDSARCRC